MMETEIARPDAREYLALFLSGVPMLDVRAPLEFARGAFPGAVNLPLMDDAERAQVGLRYKQLGQDAAVALGTRLVSGPLKAQRIQAWADFAQAHPQGYLYCLRGGLRSKISQQWLREEAGIDYPRVQGGYKAMREFLMEAIGDAAATNGNVVLGGMTGSGKTQILRQLAHGVDLEAHANHRGSGFGKRATPQPTQIDFEHGLAVDLLKKRAGGVRHLVLEDESRLIGASAVPLELHDAMQAYPVVWVEAPLAGRIERILQEYVVDLCAEFVLLHGDAGNGLFGIRLQESLSGISRRLGGERYVRLQGLMQAALAQQSRDGDCGAHRAWIQALLVEYYDPIYARQLQGKSERIAFRGDASAVLAYLREHGSGDPAAVTGSK